MQAEIDQTARTYGIRIMGPNCLGVLNPENGFCCFYGIQEDNFDMFVQESGSISYVIQSGGIVVIVLESFVTDVTKANKIISIGNKSDIDEADMLEYLNKDDSTEVVGMYLENIKDGKKFLEAAKKMTKPVIAFKVGRTIEGAKAAQSHTAGMANNDLIFDNACKQGGIIRAKTISELHALPKIFTHMPPLRGKRIAVFTNSGAFGGITADLLVDIRGRNVLIARTRVAVSIHAVVPVEHHIRQCRASRTLKNDPVWLVGNQRTNKIVSIVCSSAKLHTGPACRNHKTTVAANLGIKAGNNVGNDCR